MPVNPNVARHNRRRFITLPAFLMLSACACPGQQLAVFNYSDFGPQAIASEVIGMEWWQWLAHGDSRPRNYAVKVVVYRELTVDEVAQRFPVNEAREHDYRYLEHASALRYLDAKINDSAMEDITVTLRATRDRVVAELGQCDDQTDINGEIPSPFVEANGASW